MNPALYKMLTFLPYYIVGDLHFSLIPSKTLNAQYKLMDKNFCMTQAMKRPWLTIKIHINRLIQIVPCSLQFSYIKLLYVIVSIDQDWNMLNVYI